MSAAHEAGVVHRDLKPDNILLESGGRVVITDFGIARAEAHGEASRTGGLFIGTPAYMAPEQVDGSARVDGRADIYAFGAILFEMLTGRRAWPGSAALGVAAARLVGPPPDPRAVRPTLAPELAALVLRCLARDRSAGDAFVVNDEVARAIARALAAERSGKARQEPSDPVAIDLYFRARRAIYLERQDEAATLFRQALARAPDDPTILAGHAYARIGRNFFAPVPPEEARPIVRRALEVGSALADPWIALARTASTTPTTRRARSVRYGARWRSRRAAPTRTTARAAFFSRWTLGKTRSLTSSAPSGSIRCNAGRASTGCVPQPS
jgi:serine/threonine protein kinase